MRRRTLLGALAPLSLGGCLRLSEGDSDSSDGSGVPDVNEVDIWVKPDDGESGNGTKLNPHRDI